MRYDTYIRARSPGWRHQGYSRVWNRQPDIGDARGYWNRTYPGRSSDYWWLGERELDRQGFFSKYDEEYRRFSEDHHPLFTPVAGMYPPIGGNFVRERLPRPLREPTRFSDWTRWF
jgi:hypothetical protein